ncbi:MAG: VanZ family protein [Oscillospiraceae bacterium]|nr:VanZ family protein [Oscillospiraceae bacterium]
MKKSTPRLWVCGTIIAVLLAVIWGNSCLSGETSGHFSGWVGELINSIFPFLSPESKYGHFILRKLGHFSEFAALGLFLRWLFGMLLNRKWLTLSLPLACAVTVAFIDETIQIFTPGRYSSIVDVGIDSLGALTGILVLQIAWLLLRRLRRHRG